MNFHNYRFLQNSSSDSLDTTYQDSTFRVIPAYVLFTKDSTKVMSAVGTFIACTIILLFLTSAYLAWRVYIKGKYRFEKLKVEKKESEKKEVPVEANKNDKNKNQAQILKHDKPSLYIDHNEIAFEEPGSQRRGLQLEDNPRKNPQSQDKQQDFSKIKEVKGKLDVQNKREVVEVNMKPQRQEEVIQPQHNQSSSKKQKEESDYSDEEEQEDDDEEYEEVQVAQHQILGQKSQPKEEVVLKEVIINKQENAVEVKKDELKVIKNQKPEEESEYEYDEEYDDENDQENEKNDDNQEYDSSQHMSVKKEKKQANQIVEKAKEDKNQKPAQQRANMRN